jgi:imidazole glycerol-phosphate synthase subunit HisH
LSLAIPTESAIFSAIMVDAVVIDYGMGNIGSILNMGRAAGGRLVLSDSAEEISLASKLILPGVGAFDQAIANLRARGFIDAINHAVLQRRVPVLGICLGMQLFTRGSEEGDLPGLGWIAAKTIRFRIDARDTTTRIPHMGWNTLELAQSCDLLEKLPPEPRFYFVHSFHVRCDDGKDVLAWTVHGYPFPSAIHHDNIWGVQFHPEKSSKFGLALIRNFLALN